MRILLLIGLCCAIAGCGNSGGPVVESQEQQGAGYSESQTAPAAVFESQSGPPAVETEDQLAVPRFDPLPVIWLSEWEQSKPAKDEATEQRRSAETGRMFADTLKAEGNYKAAEKLYLQVLQTDSTYAFAAYQLACNYELWGRHEDAVRLFERSIDLGYYDFPTVLSDDELGEIRRQPEFPGSLKTLLKRYKATVKPGTPIAVRPESEMPDGGYPVMLLLHGKGDSHLAWLDNARRWADMGFLAVAVPGSVPLGDRRYSWTIESTVPTHQDLQAIVRSDLLKPLIDRSRVFLLGFSLGAMHGMVLVMDHPESYRGVVALSPGGLRVDRLVRPAFSDSIMGRVMLIYGSREVHSQLVGGMSIACRKAGWKLRARSHPGGHHFPENWGEMVQKIPRFLLEEQAE